MKRALVMLATMALAGACGEAPGREGDAEQQVPTLQAVTLDGDSVSLAELRGEVVLLNVWATWCVPCRKEVPELESLHRTLGDRGLHVIGVTVDNRGAEEQIRRFIEQFGMTYDVWWDPDGTAIDEFGAAGVPLTVLLDREGRIVWRHLGAFNADNPALRDAVDTAL